MKQRISETVKKQKPHDTVIFEINDSGRENEYSRRRFTDGGEYRTAFMAFIESLGFTVTQKHQHSNSIIINDDLEADVDTSNASYMSRNAFTRDVNVRKPQNRFIRLSAGYDNYILKVFINKEMDANKLRSKINKAIADRKEREDRINEREKTRERNTAAVVNHYLSDSYLKECIEVLGVERGVISFTLRRGSVQVNASDNSVIKIFFYQKEVKTTNEAIEYIRNVTAEYGEIERTALIVELMSTLSPELAAWTTDQHHIYHKNKEYRTD